MVAPSMPLFLSWLRSLVAGFSAAGVFASRCRMVVVTPGGAYDFVWDSVLLPLLLS